MFRLVKLLVFFISISCYAQKGIVRGRVLDAKTGEPIFSAHVFIGNTSIGVTTGIDGNFMMHNLPSGQFNLVISMIGFHPEVREIQIKDDQPVQVTVLLKYHVYTLRNIDIKGTKDKKWQKKYKKFESLFLGDSPNAAYCKISNPWLINFTEDRKKDLFTAYAHEPIEVINNSLGYKLYFHLISFSVKENYINYYGIPMFESMITEEDSISQEWEINRSRTFIGSQRHFFKALINNSLEEEGFIVRNIESAKISSATVGHYTPVEVFEYSDFNRESILFKPEEGEKWVVISEKDLEIYSSKRLMEKSIYKESNSKMTKLHISDTVYCASHGYIFNPNSVVVYGFWSRGGVADMLPFEYGLKINSEF